MANQTPTVVIGNEIKKLPTNDKIAKSDLESGLIDNPMTASGDIIYGGTSGTPTRLAKGTDAQVLTLASGLPSWASPAGGATILTAVKTANETVTNSDIFQDDAHLSLSVEANTNYVFELLIMPAQSDTPADAKLQWVCPSGSTMSADYMYTSAATTFSHFPRINNATTIVGGIFTDMNNGNLRGHGTLFVGANAGTIQLQWAQSTARALTLTFYKGSYLKLVKVA